MIRKLWNFLSELYRFRHNNRLVVSSSSYILMRRMDIHTLGWSTKLLRACLAPRRYHSQDDISHALAQVGFAKIGSFDGPHIDALTRCHVFCRAKPELSGSIDAIEKLAGQELGRLDIYDQEILSSKAIAEFITQAPFLQMAKNHYGRDVICVKANAWWSIPTTRQGHDGAAQKFHRDIDWLGELKFFVFATDVSEDNGPFDFITGSHRKRLDRFMLRDGRIEESDMFHAYDKKHLASTLCQRGDVFAVDTRGYHRGRPVISGRRCVMSVEFTVNKFGAEAQYQPKRPALDPAWESYGIWKKAIEQEPAWAGLFSALPDFQARAVDYQPDFLYS